MRFSTETAPLMSGAWLDVIPTLALVLVGLTAVVLVAYVVERVKHARQHPDPAKPVKPRYRRTGR